MIKSLINEIRRIIFNTINLYYFRLTGKTINKSKKTFYVQEIEDKKKLPSEIQKISGRYIGLFDNNSSSGRGTMMGWFAQEFYHNTVLLAVGVMSGHFESTSYHYPFNEGVYQNINKRYRKIRILSVYREERIKASSVDEAVAIFTSQSWKDKV